MKSKKLTDNYFHDHEDYSLLNNISMNRQFEYIIISLCTEACNYLLVYEYVISADIQTDTWAGMKRAIATKGLHSPRGTGGSTGANRTLFLGGRKDGQICVFNWETGAVEFEIEVN